MLDYLEQVEATNRAGIYYMALAGALVVPDICAALESPDGRTTGNKYAAWFDTHAATKMHGTFSGRDCWLFRCGFLHQGTSESTGGTYSRVMFFEPGATTVVIHGGVLDDVLLIDVQIFVTDVVDAARAWWLASQGSEPFEANAQKLIRRYPDGLAPYIGGIPVIA